MDENNIIKRLQDTDYEPVCVEAIEEIQRLRSIIKDLLPYMILDMEQALIMGPAPSNHPDDNCPDCVWYKESLAWKERIDSGEFREFREQ